MGPFWAEFTASCMVLLDSSSHSRYVCFRQTLAHFVFGDQVGSRPRAHGNAALALHSSWPLFVLQEVGASQGLTALHGKAAPWSSLFSIPPVKEVLPAICGLIRPPLGGPQVAQIFGPQLMAAVGRVILSGDALQQELGMPLLVELCMALKPEGSASSLPVILTAEQNGVQLAAYINSIVNSWPKLPPSSGFKKLTQAGDSSAAGSDQETGSSVAAAWVAVLCLPHANSNPGQIVKLLQGLITKTASVLQGSTPYKGAKLQGSSVADMAEVLFLQCYARGVLATVLEAHDPAQLSQHLDNTMQLLSQHPLDFHVVRCAAEVAGVVTKGGKKLPVQQLKVHAVCIYLLCSKTQNTMPCLQ